MILDRRCHTYAPHTHAYLPPPTQSTCSMHIQSTDLAMVCIEIHTRSALDRGLKSLVLRRERACVVERLSMYNFRASFMDTPHVPCPSPPSSYIILLELLLSARCPYGHRSPNAATAPT